MLVSGAPGISWAVLASPPLPWLTWPADLQLLKIGEQLVHAGDLFAPDASAAVEQLDELTGGAVDVGFAVCGSGGPQAADRGENAEVVGAQGARAAHLAPSVAAVVAGDGGAVGLGRGRQAQRQRAGQLANHAAEAAFASQPVRSLAARSPLRGRAVADLFECRQRAGAEFAPDLVKLRRAPQC